MTTTAEPWTVRRLLEWTAGFFSRREVDAPRLSSELLLAHVLGVPRIKLYTDYDKVLPEAVLTRFRELVRRGGEHEPIAYLTGRTPFFGLEIAVTPAVLIPRGDTETLVENVAQLCRTTPGLESPRVLDLCTGSGCIAAALATRLKTATFVATDISPAALEVAAGNFARLGVADRITVREGDLYAALDGMVDPAPFDLIVANPPYVPSADIAGLDRNVRDHEPHLALDGGGDGLRLVSAVLTGSAALLTPGVGRVYVEIQFDQGPRVVELAGDIAGLTEPRIIKDHSGHDRVVTARRT